MKRTCEKLCGQISAEARKTLVEIQAVVDESPDLAQAALLLRDAKANLERARGLIADAQKQATEKATA